MILFNSKKREIIVHQNSVGVKNQMVMVNSPGLLALVFIISNQPVTTNQQAPVMKCLTMQDYTAHLLQWRRACVDDIIVGLPSLYLLLALLCRRLPSLLLTLLSGRPTICCKGFNGFFNQHCYVSFGQWFATVTHCNIQDSICIICISAFMSSMNGSLTSRRSMCQMLDD